MSKPIGDAKLGSLAGEAIRQHQVAQHYYSMSSEFAQELLRARTKFPTLASAHEGHSVMMEEMEELWDIIKMKQSERDYTAMRKEVIQLGAMVLAFLVEVVEVENRR